MPDLLGCSRINLIISFSGRVSEHAVLKKKLCGSGLSIKKNSHHEFFLLQLWRKKNVLKTWCTSSSKKQKEVGCEALSSFHCCFYSPDGALVSGFGWVWFRPGPWKDHGSCACRAPASKSTFHPDLSRFIVIEVGFI